MQKFWNWIQAGDGAGKAAPARLILSGVIDTGVSWYEDTITPKAFLDELNAHEGESIVVEINSPGGDVFAGWEIYNALRARSGETVVRITGVAASAASVIAMAADEGCLTICEVGMMMVHNPYTEICGNAEALREQADVLDLIRDVMLSAYMRRFKGRKTEMIALMDAESYLTPSRALELGLTDIIEQDGEAHARMTFEGRYAALDTAALRERFKLPADQPPRGEAAAPTRDYLAEADAMIDSITEAGALAPVVIK